MVEIGGGTDLFDLAVIQDGYPIAERHGFVLVVGDVDECGSELALQCSKFGLEFLAQLEVEGTERFIEQEHAGLIDDGAGEGDALTLAAGELVGFASGERADAGEIEHAIDSGENLGFGQGFHAQAELDILADVEVGEEGVVLEDGIDWAQVGWGLGNGFGIELDITGVGLFEAGEDAEQGGFAAAGRAEQGEVFTGTNGEAEAAENGGGVETFGQVEDFEPPGGSGLIHHRCLSDEPLIEWGG